MERRRAPEEHQREQNAAQAEAGGAGRELPDEMSPQTPTGQDLGRQGGQEALGLGTGVGKSK